MALHRFAVGDMVELSSDKNEAKPAGGPYTVMRLLPGEPNAREYHIKSAHEGHERAVREAQIRTAQAGAWRNN